MRLRIDGSGRRWQIPALTISKASKMEYPFMALPVIVGGLLSGWSGDILPLASGLIICLVAFVVGLWRVADAVSVRWANSVYSADEKILPRTSRLRKERRETWFRVRAAAKRAMFAVTLVSFLGPLLIGFRLLENWERKRALDRARTDYTNGLKATPAEAYSNGAIITFRNEGAQPVTLVMLQCDIHVVSTTWNWQMHDIDTRYDGEFIRIGSGGDGQAMHCPFGKAKNVIPGSIVCADVTWTVDLAADFDIHPESKQIFTRRKQFRYILSGPNSKWEQEALESKPITCPAVDVTKAAGVSPFVPTQKAPAQ